MIAKHAGMNDKLDVIFFISPHDVIPRFFESLGKDNKSNLLKFVVNNG